MPLSVNREDLISLLLIDKRTDRTGGSGQVGTGSYQLAPGGVLDGKWIRGSVVDIWRHVVRNNDTYGHVHRMRRY